MEFQAGQHDSLKDFDSWEEAQQVMRSELAQARSERMDLRRRIEQSQGEVDKLAKRNALMTVNLQKVQSAAEPVSQEEIKGAYDSSLETLQRLYVMRGQLEKMGAEEEALGHYIDLLEGVEQIMDMGVSNAPGSAGSFATVEMMIRAQEAERQRLSRQMHDGPAQALANFILQAEIATRFFDVNQDKAREELQILKSAATDTFQQVRDFIFTLRPMMLDDLGAVPTVKRYADALKNQTGVEIVVTVTGAERRLESYVEVIIFRSIQELLGNAITNSLATEVNVQIDLAELEVRVSVEDNGNGFESANLDNEDFMGIKLIKERSEMLGGTFEIDSAPGQGSRISFRIPVARAGEMV